MFVTAKDTPDPEVLATLGPEEKRMRAQAARPMMDQEVLATQDPVGRSTPDLAEKIMPVPVGMPMTDRVVPHTMAQVALVTLARADPLTMVREDPVTRALVVTVRNVQRLARRNSANRISRRGTSSRARQDDADMGPTIWIRCVNLAT